MLRAGGATGRGGGAWRQRPPAEQFLVAVLCLRSLLSSSAEGLRNIPGAFHIPAAGCGMGGMAASGGVLLSLNKSTQKSVQGDAARFGLRRRRRHGLNAALPLNPPGLFLGKGSCLR